MPYPTKYESFFHKKGGYATAAKNLYDLGHFVGGYNILLRIE
jgi:hypothetical protein